MTSSGGAADSQFLALAPLASGLLADYVEVDLDPAFADSVPEAWMSVRLYIPGDTLAALPTGDSTQPVLQSDMMGIRVHDASGVVGSPDLTWQVNGQGYFVAPVVDAWTVVEWHQTAGLTTIDVRIDGVDYPGVPLGVTAPAGVNYVEANPMFLRADVGPGAVIYVDEVAYSATGWVSDVGPDAMWAFGGADPLGDAAANYPAAPFVASNAGGSLSIETSGPAAPGGPAPADVLP
jgi:hypothetical protein